MLKWKLNRKQKVLRNLLVTLAALGTLWWMLEFPALTTRGLLRRAEQAYLLDGNGEILHSDSWLEGGRILSRYEDRLMSMNWERVLLGRRFGGAILFEPEVQHILFYCSEGVQENGVQYWYPQLELWGLMGEASAAELEWTVTTKDGAQMTWTLPSARKDDHCLTFAFQRQYAPGADGVGAKTEERLLRGDYVRDSYSALIRFYDVDGALMEIHHFENVGYGYNTSNGGEKA